MPRQRVLSFISQWGGPPRSPSNSAPPSPTIPQHATRPSIDERLGQQPPIPPESPARSQERPNQVSRDRSGSRPTSMIMPYQPSVMESAQDTPPELQPIFNFLNSHSNKLYQEGYFLKLHDLDSRGRPSTDRTWNECFAQLVGTILSLWDAAQLDLAGDDGEVVPTFINLTDASIKMIESLPMNGDAGQTLQNVLSISTAANNRYLLHFNSLHSLTQWTAGIRLAMYEHATLQEAYTGSILAGKGKYLNNIRSIMERSRFPTQDWARVRFGAGTPWRRCWCVISPPDEKEYQKAQKESKKRTAYDRSQPIVKGDIKFYDTRKVTKKTKPIATITNAFSAYAIYPQSRPLIEQSTLMKVEGQVTIHSTPESTTEGFVFVMPEVHPAISGFEMMLRWLIPAFDTFALYGRPMRLIADTLDIRSLMFAMPSQRRYGYLELLDVTGLIHAEGSDTWTEREWRKQLKVLTSKRMTGSSAGNPRASTTLSDRDRTSRSSLNLSSMRTGGIKFGDDPSTRSNPGSRRGSPPLPIDNSPVLGPPRANTTGQLGVPVAAHQRSVSDTPNYARNRAQASSQPQLVTTDAFDGNQPPQPPPHGVVQAQGQGASTSNAYPHDLFIENQVGPAPPAHGVRYSPVSPAPMQGEPRPVRPVAAPPAFAHKPRQRPLNPPNAMPDLRLANASMDPATLAQMQAAQSQSLAYRTPSQGEQLPTIPGTPAYEMAEPIAMGERPHNDAPAAASARPQSIARKPVGS